MTGTVFNAVRVLGTAWTYAPSSVRQAWSTRYTKWYKSQQAHISAQCRHDMRPSAQLCTLSRYFFSIINGSARLHCLNKSPCIILRFLDLWPLESSSNWSYETHQLVSSKRRESTGMSNLPFSSYCQAHFDRLHLFQCSTWDISWSWHTQRTSWKCRISKHCCFY